MTYEEALKQVKSQKASEHRMLFSFSYDCKLVVTHKAGMALMEALKEAEKFENSYSGPPDIHPIRLSQLEVQLISQEEYQRYKIAQLLKLHYDEVKDIEEQQTH